MRRETVFPAEGRKVRDPATGKPIAPEGAVVTWSPYWQRRLDDGDLAPASAAPETPKRAPKSPASKES